MITGDIEQNLWIYVIHHKKKMSNFIGITFHIISDFNLNKYISRNYKNCKKKKIASINNYQQFWSIVTIVRVFQNCESFTKLPLFKKIFKITIIYWDFSESSLFVGFFKTPITCSGVSETVLLIRIFKITENHFTFFILLKLFNYHKNALIIKYTIK